MKATTKTEKHLRKYLKDLIQACEKATQALDVEMKNNESHQRGQRIAKICNFLDFNKDSAKHFGLGEKL